jgi:hypothetical protein
MDNTLKQSPCLIAAYLQGQCANGGESHHFTLVTFSNGLNVAVFSLGSLGPGYIYLPGDGNNACTCSTVTYSLIAACALCQGAGAGK